MRFLLAASLIFCAATASADSKVATKPAPTTSATADVKQMHTDDCARARAQNKTCIIDMGKDAAIEGNAPTAGGSAIGIIEFSHASSLIHIRRDFIVEILKSAEDLD